jgi:hypothetical protein
VNKKEVKNQAKSETSGHEEEEEPEAEFAAPATGKKKRRQPRKDKQFTTTEENEIVAAAAEVANMNQVEYAKHIRSMYKTGDVVSVLKANLICTSMSV